MVMYCELERMWKDAIIEYCAILFQHLPGVTEENHKETLVRTVCFQSEIPNRKLPNMKKDK
jgi:hypothetical protein